jgi:cytochrome c553
MRAVAAALAATSSLAGPAVAQALGDATVPSPPAWAYPVNPPGFKPEPDDGAPRHVPDSAASYPLSQLRDLFLAPDWHPGDHGPMPEVVSRGRKPEVFACGYCHRADGPGGPENSSLAGLPAAYIVQQVADFKSGARRSSVPERLPVLLMISLAKAATDAEVRAAASYFAALKPRSIIRVVETDTVPKTFVAGWFLAAVPSGGTEPLGQRIVEVPQDLEQFEHRDARSRFIAYAPVGSIAKGEALAKSGGAGKTVACGTCHGPGLKGLGPVPGIAGRSPSYVVRQLYDFRHGARASPGSLRMKPAVKNLALEDMIFLAAYLASLAP